MSYKSKESKSASRPLVKVKTQKVSLVTQSQVALDRPKGLGESFAITISSGHVSNTYTVHRPIGITDLEDDDWVVTAVADIPSLLTRAEDPAQGQINRTRALLKTEMLIEEGLLRKEGDSIFYPKAVWDELVERNVLLNEADSKFNEYKRTIREEFKKTNPKATQLELDTIKFDRVRQDFLDEKLKLHEKEIAKFLNDPDLKDEIENAVPQTYRTMSGPSMDQPQVACMVIGKTNTTGQAVDKLNSWVYQNLVKGKASAFPEPLKKNVVSNIETTSQSSSKKSSLIEAAKKKFGLIPSTQPPTPPPKDENHQGGVQQSEKKI